MSGWMDGWMALILNASAAGINGEKFGVSFPVRWTAAARRIRSIIIAFRVTCIMRTANFRNNCTQQLDGKEFIYLYLIVQLNGSPVRFQFINEQTKFRSFSYQRNQRFNIIKVNSTPWMIWIFSTSTFTGSKDPLISLQSDYHYNPLKVPFGLFSLAHIINLPRISACRSGIWWWWRWWWWHAE